MERPAPRASQVTSDWPALVYAVYAMGTNPALHIDALGLSTKHAVRQLLTEFRYRGWKDPGDAALRVVMMIERNPGISCARAADAAPSAFFETNSIRKKDLARVLSDLAGRS